MPTTWSSCEATPSKSFWPRCDQPWTPAGTWCPTASSSAANCVGTVCWQAPTRLPTPSAPLSAVDILDEGRVYWALRTILVSRADEIPAFDDCFQRYWNFKSTQGSSDLPARAPRQQGTLRAGNLSAAPSGLRVREPEQQISVDIVRTGASAAERAGGRELRGLGVDGWTRCSRPPPGSPGRCLPAPDGA